MADILVGNDPPLAILHAPQKTITFTGGANAGKLADPIHIWTVSGTVIVLFTFANFTTGLVSAGGGSAFLATADGVNAWTGSGLGAGVAVTGAQFINGVLVNAASSATVLDTANDGAIATLSSMQITPGTADLTAGVVVCDAWYIPVIPGASLSLAFAGVAQVETATVVEDAEGVITAGNATVIVTAAGMTGSPVSVSVALATNDATTAVATKIRAGLTADPNVGAWFTISGTGAHIVATVKAITTNDQTMNIDIDNGTSAGLTDEPTSTHTTQGQPVV